MVLTMTHHFNHKGLSLSQNEQKIKKNYMKHFKAYLLCLGLALITVSCSQDDFGNGDSDSENLVEMSFIAGSSQPITRTVLGSDGATVTWQANDKIGIGFKGNQPKNYPFTTPTSGSDVHFWGQAPDVNNLSYFMMYPYQQDAKISANSNTQAIYQYNFPKEQNAIAGTFDPKANVSVGIIPQRGKPFIAYNKQEINIQRAKVYDLGEMTLDPSKAKAFILKNQGLIEAVGAKVSGGLTTTADGHLDIYAADNLEKILSYKGMLEIKGNPKLTSIDELQYYRNVNGLTLQNNTNLAGELNFNKYPQLTDRIEVAGSPLVTKVNVTGLDKISQLQAHDLSGLKEVVTGGNTKLNLFALYGNNSLESVDASNMPALTNLQTYYSSNIKTINTTNSPNLNNFNGISNYSLQNFIGLSDNSKLQTFWASGSKIESYDFSKMTNLRDVNLASAAVKEIKGLSAAGANLKELQLSNTHVGSLDVSNNPNLTKLDLYNVREMTTLDVTHNPNLIYLRTTFIPFTSLDLSNNTKLVELSIAHNKLSSFDIRHMPNLAKFYAGSQKPNGFLANITVTMTAAQKAKLEQVKPFKESANDDRANYDDTNSWVKVVVAP